MAWTMDISNDLELVYGLDTFTLKVEGQSDIVLTECVLTEPVQTKEMEPSHGQVPQMDQLMVWRIARSPTQPTMGSVLVDSVGTYWTILAVLRKQHVECWEARCRNLSILAGAENNATVLKAVYGKATDNEAKPTWLGIFSGATPATEDDVIRAKFQPSAEDALIRFGADFSRETYRVILDRRLPITLAGGSYRLVDSAGVRYRITHYADEGRIDVLPVAIAVKITEGDELVDDGL
jgi:hypothetical protein